MKKVRLDQLVFDQGLSESRERAKAIIMSLSLIHISEPTRH